MSRGTVTLARGARRRARPLVLAIMLALPLARPAAAADRTDGSATAAPVADLTSAEIAKQALNPFSQAIKLPLQSVTGFRIGRRDAVGESVSLEPVLPVSIDEDWTVIVQPSLTGTYLPSPGAAAGLQDIQVSTFLTPARAGTWVWGVGPIVELPSATDDALGTGKWSGGPTAALIASSGPWVNGVLLSHLASFAGDADRPSVNATSLQAQVSYTFEDGWYVQTDPTITYDWAGSAWTVPVGADVGCALSLGSQQVTLQLGAYDLVARPAGDPAWILRAQMTLVLPMED